MRKVKKILSSGLSLLLCFSLAVPALAVEYDIAQGNVTIDATGSEGVQVGATERSRTNFTANDRNVTVTGNSTENNITVGANVTDVTVTLRDVNIELPLYGGKGSAMSVGQNSNVTVELDGNNTLESSKYYAGLELKENGSVTIQDKTGTAGSLTATGNGGAAGIGSASFSNAGDITIDHAKVKAESSGDGDYGSAAIGSSSGGSVRNITIRNSDDLTANVGDYSSAVAAIGSGSYGKVTGSIRIENSDRLQAGNHSGGVFTGIGSGYYGTVQGGIFIEGCDDLCATGTKGSAGIGSGEKGTVNGGISIKNSNRLTATGMGASGKYGGAGIGTGVDGTVTGGISIEDCDGLTAQGTGYNGGTGIGAAGSGTLNGDITIKASNGLKASSTSYTGIGADGSMIGSILIENCDSLHAEGSNTGIGTGVRGTITGKVSIKDCADLKAIGTSGSGIGACGSTWYSEKSTIDGGIEIALREDDTLTAISKYNGTGIGCNEASSVGGITIQGGNIIAIAGSDDELYGSSDGRPGIGGDNAGTVTLKDLTSLLALGRTNKKTATDNIVCGVQGSVSAVQSDGRGILNIHFDDSLIDSSKKWKDQNVYVQVLDAQGNKVGDPIPMCDPMYNAKRPNYTLNHLALLAEPGTYYVCVTTGSGDDASVKLARLAGSSQLDIDRTVTAQEITSETLSAFTGKNDTVYEFQFDGDATPPAVKAPESSNGEALTLKFFQDNTSELSTYEDIVLEDGTGFWHFDGWSRELGPVNDGGDEVVFTAKMTGKWTFVPAEEDDDPAGPTDPVNPAIPDDDIPLADGAAATTIEEEETPLAGLFTRADAIGYLWEQTGSPEAGLSDFPDMPEDHYWAVAIGWAQDMGIALPDEEGNFRPDDLVLLTSDEPEGELQEFLNRYAVFAGIELEEGELFIELEADDDGIIMGEEAQVIFDEFFAKLEVALEAQAA